MPNAPIARLSRNAFTWVELFVILTIILTLAILLTPAFKRARESARRIGLAFKQYAIDNRDQFPFHSTDVAQVFLQLTNGGYLTPGKTYACPSDSPRTGNPLTSSNISYGCVVFPTNALSEMYPDMPLILERGIEGAGPFQPVSALIGHGYPTNFRHHVDGANVFYAGGQAGFRKFPLETNLFNDIPTNAIALFPR